MVIDICGADHHDNGQAEAEGIGELLRTHPPAISANSHSDNDYNVGICNEMIDNDSASYHQLGREAATSNNDTKAKGDLDGDLYQDHPVADHSVASAPIDLLPHFSWNDFDDNMKPVRYLKEIEN